MGRLAPMLRPGAVVTDVGSVKSVVRLTPAWKRRAPILLAVIDGGSKNGVAAARADLSWRRCALSLRTEINRHNQDSQSLEIGGCRARLTRATTVQPQQSFAHVVAAQLATLVLSLESQAQ
jgi:hypothetical protein